MAYNRSNVCECILRFKSGFNLVVFQMVATIVRAYLNYVGVSQRTKAEHLVSNGCMLRVPNKIIVSLSVDSDREPKA